MTDWLEWARGPVFVFSFTLMILGLIRNFLLTIWGIIKALSRAGDKKLPWKQLLGATLVQSLVDTFSCWTDHRTGFSY